MKRILDTARRVINNSKGRQRISLEAYEGCIDHMDMLPAEVVGLCITFNQEYVEKLVLDFMDSGNWGAEQSADLLVEIRFRAVQRKDLVTKKEELEEVQENV